ncbi:MAG: hypothetical protein K2R98_15310 [Gemmataceae bacterium]|nr:hypothetical protein [Gemmataceae bacterium]
MLTSARNIRWLLPVVLAIGISALAHADDAGDAARAQQEARQRAWEESQRQQ